MHCPSESAFQKFADDQLPELLERQIAEHIEQCSDCRQRADAINGGPALRSVKQSKATLRTPRAGVTFSEPEGLRADLYEVLPREPDLELLGCQPATELVRLLSAGPRDDVAGVRLGRFTVRRWLGAGGFGVVFLAYDELLHRELALKLPLAALLTRRQMRERFFREAEAAAQLDHPGVVPVFESGEEQGICYIASAYCSGPTLEKWLSEQTAPVPIPTAVALVQLLAEAVQHAHQHRVLHRDIKPGNVLLEPDPASPGGVAPRITDFGLAKLLDNEAATTISHGLLGTPGYMAPEQASGNRGAVGPATDVFALGAVLYELLTGVAPFAGEDQAQTLHRLLYQPAVPANRLRMEVPRDLDAICLKCLEKRPIDRYPTAQEMADDLRRFSQGHATHARPVGRLESVRRWMLRQPMAAALLGVTIVGLLAVLGVFAVHLRSLHAHRADLQSALYKTQSAQQALEAHQKRMRRLLYSEKIELAHQAVQEDDLRQATQLLSEILAENADVPRGFVWRYLANQVAAQGREVDDAAKDIYELQFNPSRTRFAACGADGMLRIYDAQSYFRLASWATDQGEINALAFSPDESSIATAGDNGTVRLWDARSGRLQRTIQAHSQLAFGVLFMPDGKSLITCGEDPEIRRWDVQSGALLGTLKGHSRPVESIALSPDGTHLASTSSDATARLWDLKGGETRHVLAGHQGRVVDARYSESGDYLITGSIDRTIRLWRTADGHCVYTARHLDPIESVALLGEASQLVAADRSGAIHVWGRTSQEGASEYAYAPLHRWKAHDKRIWIVTPTADREGLLSGGADGKIQYWQRPNAGQQSLEVPAGHTIRDLVFEGSSERLDFIDSVTGVVRWDIDSNQQSLPLPNSNAGDRHPLTLCLLPGETMATAFDDGTIDGWDIHSHEQRFHLQVPWQGDAAAQPDELAASRDGRRLAAFAFSREASVIYDLPQRRVLDVVESYSHSMALSDDGRRLAMSDGDDVVVWDLDREVRIAQLRGHTSSIVALQFSPDGRSLASGSNDRDIRLWDLETQSESARLVGHRSEVQAIAFSPDGRILASGDREGELKFWRLPDATEAMSIEERAPIEGLVFSPDGQRLAAHSSQCIWIFNAPQHAQADP